MLMCLMDQHQCSFCSRIDEIVFLEPVCPEHSPELELRIYLEVVSPLNWSTPGIRFFFLQLGKNSILSQVLQGGLGTWCQAPAVTGVFGKRSRILFP